MLTYACVQITVFKSRTDVAMLQSQDQLARLEEELVVTRAKYDKVRVSVTHGMVLCGLLLG
jgi:hypothetical protein